MSRGLTTSQRTAVRAALDATLKPAKVPKVLKFGSVSFPTFTAKDGRVGFRYKTGSGWRHKLRTDIDDLREDANRIALAIINAETAALDITAEDRRIYIAARDALDPRKVDAVARDAAEAFRIAGPNLALADLARFYKRHYLAKLTEKTVAELVKALRAEKDEMALSGRRKRDLKNDLSKFETKFGATLIADVTADEILGWLRDLQAEQGFDWKRRNHLRDIVVCLFNYAKAKGYLPQDRNTAADAVPRLPEPKDRKKVIETFTPQEMCAWIANIKPEFRPWLLICGFVPIRSEEVAPDKKSNKDPLRWEDYKPAKGYFKVRRETSKVGESRIVPVPANLAAFLEDYRGFTGPICPGEQPSKRETSRLGRISSCQIDGEVVRLTWKQNALRHTCISALLGLGITRAQVAERGGTSEAKIRKHYNEAMDEDEAKAWFAIMPDRAQNILPLWDRVSA